MRFLYIYAILCHGWCQIFHCQRVLLVLGGVMRTVWMRDFYNTFLTSTNDGLQIKHSLYRFIVEYVTVLVQTQTFVLFRELPEAVPFILQCCSASFAISEMNFWDANDMRRILTTQNKDDSDNQLIRRELHEWTVFRLTCSLHSVHCSLLPAHGKLAEVYFT